MRIARGAGFCGFRGPTISVMCYRVRNDGKLKRMLRIPVELRGEKA